VHTSAEYVRIEYIFSAQVVDYRVEGARVDVREMVAIFKRIKLLAVYFGAVRLRNSHTQV